MSNEFVYPFNFVPPADQDRRKNRGSATGIGADKQFQELHCYPPGTRTGRIEFTLTNLSPLFIPDPEHATYYKKGESEEGEPQFHRVVDFFNVGGRLAIPGTSLKGMFRSVAEALSNSSFGVFAHEDSQKHRFTFRKPRDRRHGPKDVSRRQWGQWLGDNTILPLRVAKLWRQTFDGALGITDETRVEAYRRIREDQPTFQVELWQLHTGAPHVRRFTGTYTGEVFPNNTVSRLQPGRLCKRRRQPFKSQVDPVGGALPIPGPLFSLLERRLCLLPNGPWSVHFATVSGIPSTSGGTETRVCKLKYTGGASSNTWDAHFPRKLETVQLIWPQASLKYLPLYIPVLYRPGTALKVAPRALSDYETAHGTLPKTGDGVCFYEVACEVVEFGPVAMFKSVEQASVAQIAARTKGVLPCESNRELCPASRLFGWAPPTGRSGDHENQMPIAGRVRVSVAWSTNTLHDTQLLPLQILGSPKPKYYPFYLRSPAIEHTMTDSGATTGSESGAKGMSSPPGYYALEAGDWSPTPGLLGGRKFYLHHRDTLVRDPANASSEQLEAACNAVKITADMINEDVAGKAGSGEATEEDVRTNQNATAALLPPGGTFKGYVEFDSLTDYELGMLLWAISLSDSPLEACQDRAHKLGMGRPIGMGSVRVAIARAVTWDPVAGWRNGDVQGEQSTGQEESESPIGPEEAQLLVKTFKTWMVNGLETADDDTAKAFDEQGFFRDLCHVLSLDLAAEGPVQYHPPQITNDRGVLKDLPAYKGFEYFMKQRAKRTGHASDKEETLHIPSAIHEGKRQHG